MSQLSADENMLGRLALHYKMLEKDQLMQAIRYKAEVGQEIKLGQILVSKGLLNERQLQQLLKVQADVEAKKKHAATAPSSAKPAAQAPPKTQAKPAASPNPPTSAPSTAANVPPPVKIEVSKDEALAGLDIKDALSLLKTAAQMGASDVHIHAGSPLSFRINGEMQVVHEQKLERRESQSLVRQILSDKQYALVEENGQVDFSHAISGTARYRGNAYRHQRGTDMVLRVIHEHPPSLEELGLPSSLASLVGYHQGMCLVTGPSGCGKSTTFGALLDIINTERPDHILTIEDPIEFVHPSKGCIVNQRQVPDHTASFSRALKGALREDPDVIAIGELRDLETVSLALKAAETGHFVLGTLHTGSAIRTLNRVIGVFPANQQDQIRTMVSESLKAIISQRLVTRADGKGRIPALEVLVVNKAVSNLIRENKTFQIRSILQTGSSRGMMLLDQSLAKLYKDGVITREVALKHADDPKRFPQ